jgi:hypothetical protein
MSLQFDISIMPKRKTALTILIGLLPFVVWSQTNLIRPTVTVSMGDVGGKLYGQLPDPAKTRHYYIAAEPQLWDFAPEGRDVICGMPLPPAVLSHHASMKIRYVAYTDATFTRRERENPSLGILGPVLRGVVGENLAITFWNRSDIPLSMHPHGLKYDKDSEGSYYQPHPGLGAAVAPGAKFTYVWQIDESSGPLPSEPSSKAWLYHSHVTGDEEVNLGLVGFIIVTDPKRARPDGTPADVDREFGSLFMIFNESGLDVEAEEAEEQLRKANGSLPAKSWSQVQELKEEGERYAINGRIFGNLPGLEMNAGEHVRWYLFALGSENDFHTPHWHGLRAVESGRSTDVIELLPASMKVADMVADNPGSWLFHCHVAEHMMEGMFARVTVYSTGDHSPHRAPEPAFLGLSSAQQPLQVQRAEASVDFASDAARPCEIKMDGDVMVPEAFAVSKNPVRIELGGHSVTFNPGRNGTDENANGSFHVENFSKNSSEYGIVYGGRLKFTIALSGRAWRDELIAAGLKINLTRAQEVAVPLFLETGGAKHHATIRITAASR